MVSRWCFVSRGVECARISKIQQEMHCQQSFFPGFIISRLFQSRTKRTIPRVPAHPRRRCRIFASNIIICRYTPAGRVLLERRHTLCQQHGHLIAQQSACLLTTLSSIRFLPCHVIITTTTIITTAPMLQPIITRPPTFLIPLVSVERTPSAVPPSFVQSRFHYHPTNLTLRTTLLLILHVAPVLANVLALIQLDELTHALP
jgi:hypothetical protein